MGMFDLIWKEMEELGADGVDFVPVFAAPKDIENGLYEVIMSYSKEKFRHKTWGFPKTGRLYWKKINNKKVYFERGGRK